MQNAGLRLIGRKPAGFFGAAGQFEAEICDWVNEVAADIVRHQDWQALQSVATLAGDGTDFPLPDDYDRMNVVGAVQDVRNWARGYYGFVDINRFITEEARGFTPYPGGWIIYGDRIRFSPAPGSNGASFPYISNAYAVGADGVRKSQFTADTDSFVLDERLLTLGLVWRWRENKSLASTGDQEAFALALNQYAAKDKGSRVLRFGSAGRAPNTSLPYIGIAF